MDRWAGRVAVVTGASAGIGAGIAAALTRAGLRVVGLARREHLVQALAESLRLEGAPGELVALQADVSSEEGVREAYRWVEEHLGGISVVVNNAAVTSYKPVQDETDDVISSLVNTNIMGVIRSCRHALFSMKKHDIKDGHIININSILGHEVKTSRSVSLSVYGATKFSVTAFCKGLRRDTKKMKGFRIRISSISPGGVDTDMLPKSYRDAVGTFAIPEDVLLRPEDVADAVLYVLSSPPSVEICELTIKATGEDL